MSSHFIHINLKKGHDRNLTKTLETNITSDDKTKSKSSIIANNQKKSSHAFKDFKIYTYNKFVDKHNTLPYQYSLIQIDNFIKGKYCHSLASFKEEIMFNFNEEFLKKLYKIKEIRKKIPLFYEFYKTYLKFFCSPTFSDLDLNELIEKAVEKKAKAFYNDNYKEETHKKTKTMNIVVFTSKIRRDLSRRTDLTNLSKTTIMEANLTNKSSITSANSIAKIFNEIGSSQIPNNNNKNNNNKIVVKNKSYNKDLENENHIDNNNEEKKNINKKNNIVSIQIKNINSINNNNRNTIKVNLNAINDNIVKNSNFIIKNNYNITDTNKNYPKISIKKKNDQFLKTKDNKSNNPSLTSSIKLYINKMHKKIKRSPLTYNTMNNGNKNLNINNNKYRNNTTSNISKYNKKNIKKPNSRNYEVGFLCNKNTYTHLDGNIINKMNSYGNNISNNYANLTNSIESRNKFKTKKLIKRQKLDLGKKINSLNKKNINIMINQDNKNILNNNGNIKENKNSQSLKQKIEGNEIKIDISKIKKNTNDVIYKKISPFKKPDSTCGSKIVIKGIIKTISNKRNNFNTIQPKNSRASNIKRNWKIKEILYQKQSLNSKSKKDNNKNQSKK